MARIHTQYGSDTTLQQPIMDLQDIEPKLINKCLNGKESAYEREACGFHTASEIADTLAEPRTQHIALTVINCERVFDRAQMNN